MMKYAWYIDQHPVKERTEKFTTSRKLHMRASAWPTVDELEEILAPMTENTLKQILHGQAVYRGWEVEGHADNDIHYGSKEPVGKDGLPRQGWHEPKIEKNPYRAIKWNLIPKMYQRCIRLIQRNKKCTRLQAQEQFLPQVMTLKVK